MVVSMHDVDLVEQMADRLLVLSDGELVYAGRVDGLSFDSANVTVPEAIRRLMQQQGAAL